MKKIYCITAFLLYLSLLAAAQTPSITNIYPETACLGTVQKIQMTVNGEFGADNKFVIQVRKNETSPIASILPAVLKDGKLEVVHTDSTLSLYSNLQLRIVSSSPKVESDWILFRINSKGFIQLAMADSDTINAGDDLQIRFTTFSSSSVQVLLNNGSEFSLSFFGESTFITEHRIGADNSDPFYIVQASNICGPMQVSGQVKAVINPVSLRATSVYPVSVCEDSEIRVGFSILGTPLPAQTKFRLRFAVYDGDWGKPNIAEAPAELKGNVLVAKFPKSLNINRRSEFKIKILTDNPAISGAYTGYDFNVYPKATALFETPSKTINLGEKAAIGVIFTGLLPFSAELQDGTKIATSFGSSSSADIRPDTTTSYTIKSFTSGCGQITSPTTQTMVVTVSPGIYLETDGETEILCAGSVVKVKMATNLDLSNASFTVNTVFASQTVHSFPAKRSGDFVEFTIPTLPANTDPTLTYDKIDAWYITTQNPAYKSNNSTKYVIQSVPEMTLLENSQFSYNAPSQALFGYALDGKGPFKIEEEGGIVHDIGDHEAWYPSFYINESRDFKLKSISNSCFKNETLPTIHLTLDATKTPPGLYIEPLKSPICRQDSLEITFDKTGTFNDGNVFKIEGYIDCCTFQTLATVSNEGKYKIKIPVTQFQSGFVTFRITSTSPEVFSESFQVELQSLPSNFSIKPVGTALLPVETLNGTEVHLSISSDRMISSFVYSNGISDITQTLESYENSALVLPPVGTTTAYTIKSATNQCGTVPVNLTTYIRTIPYRIIINAAENTTTLNFCSGGTMVIPFVTVGGKETNPTFSLQVAKDNSSEFTTLVKDELSHQFTTTVPASLEQGDYQLRVISSEGSFSNIVNIKIGAIPGATITSDKAQPIILYSGEPLVLKLDFTGSAPWTVVYEDNTKKTTTTNPDSREVYTDKGQEYSIKTVYNNCGYGTVSGKVQVKVTPRISLLTDVQQVCEGGNLTVNYQVLGDAAMGTDYLRFELIDIQTQKITVLDSTRNLAGSILLKIPSVLKNSDYQIRAIIRSINLMTILKMDFRIKANVTISGNTTINSGESTQLLIKSNNAINEAIQYTLSDGVTGTFYGGTGNNDYFIRVNPAKTTTYMLTAVSNSCGAGKFSGSAVVEVNPVSARTVTVTEISSIANAGLCLGDTIAVSFSQKGTFTAENIMTVQISDSTGKNFRPVVTVGNISPLKAVLPTDLFAGKKYRIRVAASDAGTGSGTYEYPVTASQKAKARFASESVIYDGTTSPKIIVLLEGGNYWQYQFGTDLDIQNRSTSSSSDTITLYQPSSSQYYKLFSVSNQCGPGIIENPSTVRVEVITGDPSVVQSGVIIAPNPADEYLVLKFDYALPRNIRLFNILGIPLLSRFTKNQQESLDIRNLTAGIYILEVDHNGRKSSYRIVKR